MKFVILSSGEIPGCGGIRGPILTPQQFEPQAVLKWISSGLDIREVMEDGSYRRLTFNDGRIKRWIDKGSEVEEIIEPKLIPIHEEEIIESIEDEKICVDESKSEEIEVEKDYNPIFQEEKEEEQEEIIEDSFEIDELEELD